MPAAFRNITERVAATCTGGDVNAKPNTFIRDTALSGFAILIGRSKSSYVVEGRAGRGGRVCRFTLGTVGRLALDEARAQAKERIADLARGADPVVTLRAQRGVAITLEQALELLAAGRSVKASTIADYRRSLASLGWLKRRLASIRPADVVAAYDARKTTLTSAARIFRSFRACWNAARAVHPSLPECPTVALRNVRRSWATAPRKRQVIADAHLPAWREQVAAVQHEGVRDLLLFLHYTGARVGETRALTAGDIDLKAGRFTFRAPKNGRPVDLPITTQLRAILTRRIEGAEPEAALFPCYDVRRLHAGVNACAWSYHDLRRGFITVAHRLGVDNDLARALTNHAPSGDAHAGYVSMTADTLRPEAQRIADHFDGLARNDAIEQFRAATDEAQRHKRGPKASTVDEVDVMHAAVARHIVPGTTIRAAAARAAKTYPATPAALIKAYYRGEKMWAALAKLGVVRVA